ncbi:hypothetical protein AOL_s00109g22 [Orbilia oligospora ATCC 24927]|uniref:Uncharacterized protein n=1 Tax=Arthrobotrys oligospora (strain ATCC 24927 / CBS 115.81 / DSM 1491) TaxID=756982 RepID=G1XJZ3_ARTOA|nr:hypothetical protein AOL_s00109g22 [Orbilia oligospora ATCC 24927]EGX46450.1 hypothetical protein AOL_s00109g22 [Orbilia oligospora ATCC 24927]
MGDVFTGWMPDIDSKDEEEVLIARPHFGLIGEGGYRYTNSPPPRLEDMMAELPVSSLSSSLNTLEIMSTDELSNLMDGENLINNSNDHSIDSRRPSLYPFGSSIIDDDDGIFQKCRTLDTEPRFVYSGRVSNADISLSAISGVFKICLGIAPDATCAKDLVVPEEELEVGNEFCGVSYKFEIPGRYLKTTTTTTTSTSGVCGRIVVFQCDREDVAEEMFRRRLGEVVKVKGVKSVQPLGESGIGHYAVHGDGISWVRYSIFARLKVLGDINIPFFNLARELDTHFAATPATIPQKIVPKDCFIESGKNIIVRSGDVFVVRVRQDRDHYGKPCFWVRDWGLTSMLVLDDGDDEGPGEKFFRAGRPGRTVIDVVVVHVRTMHRLRVEVGVTVV